MDVDFCNRQSQTREPYPVSKHTPEPLLLAAPSLPVRPRRTRWHLLSWLSGYITFRHISPYSGPLITDLVRGSLFPTGDFVDLLEIGDRAAMVTATRHARLL